MSGAGYAAAGISAVAAGGAAYYSSQQTPSLRADAPAPKAFQGGDQGFLSLKLESVTDLSWNTKKFRFALPEANQESGLPVACMSMFEGNSLYIEC